MLQEIEDVDEILLAPEVLDDLLNTDIVDVPEVVASDCTQTCTCLPTDNNAPSTSRYASLTEDEIDRWPSPVCPCIQRNRPAGL